MKSTAANLVEKLRACLGRESVAIADFLELLRDFDSDRTWSHLSFPSLFEFCCEALGLTAAEAANRIRLMHLVTLIPDALPALRAQRISPTGLRFIAPLLTPENFEGLLAQVQGLSTRQIEAFAQDRQAPKPCADRDQITRVKSRQAEQNREKPTPMPPTVMPRTTTEPHSTATQPHIAEEVPMAEETPEYRYHFTISEEQRSRLERVKELASHRCDPNKLASVLELLMEDFLNRHDPERKQPARTTQQAHAKQVATPAQLNTHEKTEASNEPPNSTTNPTNPTNSRHIPAATSRPPFVERCTSATAASVPTSTPQRGAAATQGATCTSITLCHLHAVAHRPTHAISDSCAQFTIDWQPIPILVKASWRRKFANQAGTSRDVQHELSTWQ